MVTIREVAKLAGVSISTVSRALSGKVFVGPETKDRVMQVVKELNYQPNYMATGLKSGKSNTIGLIIPDISNLYYPKIIKSIENNAAQKGYSLLLCDSGERVEKEMEALETLKKRSVDGVIAIAATDETTHFMALQEEKIPVVMANRLFDQEISCITNDNRWGGYIMVRYLLEQGHKNIVCMVRNLTGQIYRERYQGCVEAFREYGITDLDSRFIIGAETIGDANRLARERLSGPNRPTAIFAVTDMMAIGIYGAAGECGLRIPQDVSVAGFDNIYISQYMFPPLTTFEQPVDQIGSRAVKSLLRQIDVKGKAAKVKVKKEIIKGEIVERDSIKSL